MDLKCNTTVTKKLEQCCKVTDITVTVVVFTVDVNNEIVQMKMLSQKSPAKEFVPSPAYSIGTVYFMS